MAEEFTQEELDQLGDVQLSWQVDEYPNHDRSRFWHIMAAVLGVAFIVYAIFTGNYLFAVIILMVGVITLVTSFKAPEKVDCAITTTGVIVEDSLYDWRSIKSFSIVYELPHAKLLYLQFHSPFQPLLAIPLEEVDPNDVREFLLPYVQEDLDQDEERLTDTIRRLYKI